jgi:hypothetical protein
MTTTIEVSAQLLRQDPHHPAKWLLSMQTMVALRAWDGRVGPDTIQCRCVVDDFGDLIRVTPWA